MPDCLLPFLKKVLPSFFSICLILTVTAYADPPWKEEGGGKLLLTRGISTIDGTAGSGIVSWAMIAGNQTDRGIGGTVHFTDVALKDFDLRAAGMAVGFRNRLELSYTRQSFDTGETGSQLGLGHGFTFGQHIYGAKVRLVGDAVYDQDRWLPQISLGMLYKKSDEGSVLTALGAEDTEGIEVYLAATKLLLKHSLLISGTLRYTDANQNGLLGFGGKNDKQVQLEGSVAYLLSRQLAVGAEYRTMPDNLAFARQDDWYDIYAAYAIGPHMTFTAAYGDIGSVATFDDQTGLYLSLQSGF